jgi:phenylacetate-coenzyme A ligase PaaK-like adenylate-forming protein
MATPPFDPWCSASVAGDVLLASHADAASLQARRARRLALLLDRAARDSPLYRRLLRGRDAARLPLHALPIQHKADLMQRFDEWVTDPALTLDGLRGFTADPSRIADPYLGRYVVWESSGSSGEPGIFVQDAAAMAVYDALEALRHPRPRALAHLLDPWGFDECIAFVGAIGGHFASTVSAERLRRLNPAMARTLHQLSFLQPLAGLVASLEALQPTTLCTYPSMAVLLAEERSAGRLRIDPREVWTGGEHLSESMHAFVRQAFDGCSVVESYGASEFLALASQCRSGSLHLNSDWAVLESVDERGRPVPDGEPGATVLLTNLANHVQPLIRYDLGDRVVLQSQACACGSALPVVRVDGRSDDTLSLHTASGHAVRLLALALTTVLEEEAGLFDFQLEQTGLCALRLRSALQGEAADLALRRGRDALAAMLARHGLGAVTIRLRSGVPNRRGPGGKVRRVIALPAPGRTAVSG